LLQGFHGLVSDNFVTFNMVIANGRAITVSASSYPDLFWAMRGAGHNFGIVTSAEMRVYPRPDRDWSFKLYIWTQDNI
jgi:FAD/FMN-containing dehydrogenase